MNPFSDGPTMKVSWLTAFLIALVIGPLIAVWMIVTYFDTEISHQRAESANLTTARIISKMVEKSFDDTFHQLTAHEPVLVEALSRGNQNDVNRKLEEMLFAGPSMGGLALYAPDGKGIVHIVIPGRMNHPGLICPKSPAMNWAGTQWFRDYENADRRPVVGNRYFDPCEPGIPNAAIVMPLKTDGRELAVLRATFDIPAIDRWFKPLKLPEGVKITLFDARRMVLYDSRTTDKVTPKLIRNRQNELSMLTVFPRPSRRQLAGIYTNRRTGQRQVLAYMPIKGIRGAAWGVLVSQPLSIVDAPVKNHIIKFTAAIGALLVLGLGFVNLIRRSYARESRLSGKLMTAVDELGMMNEIATEISRGLETPQLLDCIVKNTVRLLNCQASLCMVWKDGPSPILTLAHNLPDSCLRDAKLSPTARQVVETGKSLIVNDYDSAIDATPGCLAAGVKASALVPIFIAGKSRGVLTAVSLNDGRRLFDDNDLDLLRSLARQAGIALENAFLHEETRNIADTLQKSLLPPARPHFPGFEFGLWYQSATRQALIGGDFFDFFELDGDRLAIVIGDVSGKGVAAASMTAITKNTIRAFALEHNRLSEVLACANSVISKSVRPGQFVTLFLGVLEPTGKMRYVNCGHVPPILFRRPDEFTILKRTSMPLGVTGDFSAEPETDIDMGDNDLLLLYTDGLTEARQGKRFFDQEGVTAALRRTAHLPASAIPEAIYEVIKEFSGNKLTDDLAMVAIEKTLSTNLGRTYPEEGHSSSSPLENDIKV